MNREQDDIENAIDYAIGGESLYSQRHTLIDTIRYAEKLLADVEEKIKVQEAKDKESEVQNA